MGWLRPCTAAGGMARLERRVSGAARRRAGWQKRARSFTPSTRAPSVRFHRRGQSLVRSRRDRFGARRTRDAEVRHSAAPRAAGAVLPLRHAAGGCHARSGRPARTGGSRRHKTYRLARRPSLLHGFGAVARTEKVAGAVRLGGVERHHVRWSARGLRHGEARAMPVLHGCLAWQPWQADGARRRLIFGGETLPRRRA